MEPPVRFWVPSIATSGLLFYTGDRFPGWKGNLLAGGLAGEQIARLTMSPDGKQVFREETILQGMGRVRDIRQGPDGYVYVAIDDRQEGADIGRPARADRSELALAVCPRHNSLGVPG